LCCKGVIGVKNKDWFNILLEEGYKNLPVTIPTHGPSHPQRMWDIYKENFSAKYNKIVDLDILGAAIALHDMGVFYTRESKHGELSAKKAISILKRKKFPEEKIPKVLEAIRWHDKPEDKINRKTIESQLLYDLDVIDAFEENGLRYFEILVYRQKDAFEIPDYAIKNAEKRIRFLHTPEAKNICKNKLQPLIRYFEELRHNRAKLHRLYGEFKSQMNTQ